MPAIWTFKLGVFFINWCFLAMVFKIVGKEPHEKERLNESATWSDISFFINFKTLPGICNGFCHLFHFYQSVTEKKYLCLKEGGIHEIPFQSIWLKTLYSGPTSKALESICNFKTAGNCFIIIRYGRRRRGSYKFKWN